MFLAPPLEIFGRELSVYVTALLMYAIRFQFVSRNKPYTNGYKLLDVVNQEKVPNRK
jgi:hypothetical protein